MRAGEKTAINKRVRRARAKGKTSGVTKRKRMSSGRQRPKGSREYTAKKCGRRKKQYIRLFVKYSLTMSGNNDNIIYINF